MQVAQAKQCDSLRVIPGSKCAIEVFTPRLRGKPNSTGEAAAAMGSRRAVDRPAKYLSHHHHAWTYRTKRK